MKKNQEVLKIPALYLIVNMDKTEHTPISKSEEGWKEVKKK